MIFVSSRIQRFFLGLPSRNPSGGNMQWTMSRGFIKKGGVVEREGGELHVPEHIFQDRFFQRLYFSGPAVSHIIPSYLHHIFFPD